MMCFPDLVVIVIAALQVQPILKGPMYTRMDAQVQDLLREDEVSGHLTYD